MIELTKERLKELMFKDKYLSAVTKWTGFTNLVINMPVLTFVSLMVACPIAKLGRIIVQTRRKIQSR